MDWLKTDNVTAVLAISATALFVASKFQQKTSLVHPILLGRQADVERVRQPGESAIYRNYGTGLTGRLATRPDKDTTLLSSFIKNESPVRSLWGVNITNAELQEKVSSFGAGIVVTAGLVPKSSCVMLLLNDSLEWLVADLALAGHSVPSISLTHLTVLSNVIEEHPPAAIVVEYSFLGELLKLLAEQPGVGVTIVVVGDSHGASKSMASKTYAKLFTWEEIMAVGKKSQELVIPPPIQPKDVFSVTFFRGIDGETEGVEFTHATITAGVAATRAVFPYVAPISPSDVILSGHSLSTAFGRVVAYTAIYEGASFATLDSTKILDVSVSSRNISEILSASQTLVSSPTLLFITPPHLQSLTASILNQAKSSLFYSLAWRHKLAALLAGYNSNNGFWDRLLFASARRNAAPQLAESMRGICVAGGWLPDADLIPSRIALSIPIVVTHTHPLVAGPVFSSHTHDLQTFPINNHEQFPDRAHVGPPSANVEVKLVDVADEHLEKGAAPFGKLVVRGPGVCAPVPTKSRGEELENGWTRTGDYAMARSNGTFKVDSPWNIVPS